MFQSSMSQSIDDQGDFEEANNLAHALLYWANRREPAGQAPIQPSPPVGESSQEESNNSAPFFLICSEATKEDDKEMVERWQKDAKGILIFTGLFAAVVSVLLTLTIPDLRPNSQDTSAFYLGNIYEVLADPNVTRASIPSSPPPFSPPRHAIWVNVLFLLSLVISICCALLATLWQQWARRYLYLTQHAKPRPEDRARIRAFFKNGVDTMHISFAVEGLPTLLHLSLFLFFGGLVVFLFNINKEVSVYVTVCIGIFLLAYGSVTLLPLIRHDSPYNTPLSRPFWYLYAGILYVTFVVRAFIADYHNSYSWDRLTDSRDRYRDWMLGGVEDAAWEKALEPSSEIDLGIFERTINTLVDDDSLEKFFEAIPAFFNSERDLCLEKDFPEGLLVTFWYAMDGFMGRTFALPSNSDTKKIKSRRVTICEDIINIIPLPFYMHPTVDYLRLYYENLRGNFERMQAMERWAHNTSHGVSFAARLRFAKSFVKNQDPDDRWIALANRVYHLPDLDVDLDRDNVILAILISVCRQAKHSEELLLVRILADSVTRSGISDTRPVLQHSFCTLWNDLVEKAKANPYDVHVKILKLIRHLYNDLHQGDDAPPIAIPSPAYPDDSILDQPSSYPLCHIRSHHPNPSAHLTVTVSTPPAHLPPASLHDPTSGGGTPLHEATTIAGPHSPSNSTADVSPPAATQSATLQDPPALSGNTPAPTIA